MASRFLKLLMLHYLKSLTDIYVVYLIHMQKEGKVVNKGSTACHRVNLILDSDQKVLVLSFIQ